MQQFKANTLKKIENYKLDNIAFSLLRLFEYKFDEFFRKGLMKYVLNEN